MAAPLYPPTPIRPLRADARRNRDRIIAAAGEVFGALGAEAQMDDVAAAAGLGVGTLYRHFPTKTALMGELVRRKFVRFTEALQRAADAHEAGYDALTAALRENADAIAGDAATRYAMGAGTEVFEAAAEAQQPLLELTGEVIARGHADGTLRPDLEVSDIPMLMCAIATSVDRGFDWRRHLELMLGALRSS